MVIWKLVGGKFINCFLYSMNFYLLQVGLCQKKFTTSLCTNNNLTLINMHNVFISIYPICNTLLIMQYINSYEMFQL